MQLNDEKFLTVCVLRAPMTQVLAQCIGVVRAQEDGAVLTADVTISPNRHHDQQDRKSGCYDRIPGYLISAPNDRPDLTVIECPAFETLSRTVRMDRALRRLAPDIDMLRVISEVENKSNQFHGFELIISGAEQRYASAIRRSSRWKWQEDGIIQPFEDQVTYQDDDISMRLTRDTLMDYVAAYGVDPETHFVKRACERSVLITGGIVMMAEDTRPRTSKGQQAYEKALALGIGKPEPTAAEHEAQRQMFVVQNSIAEISNRAHKAFHRLRKKGQPSLKDICSIYENFERSWLVELGPDEDPRQVIDEASGLADRVDMMAPETLRLFDLKTQWDVTRRLQFRLVQLLPEDQGNEWPTTGEINRVVRKVIEDIGVDGPRLEHSVYSRFLQLCAERGISLDVRGEIPSYERATEMADKALRRLHTSD